MMPNINPRQMQQMMKKMGISQTDINASQVIIVCSDKRIVTDYPSIQKVNMTGNTSYQISGREHIESNVEETEVEISDEDVKTVAEQAKVSMDVAKKALVDNEGDIASAIMSLTPEDTE